MVVTHSGGTSASNLCFGEMENQKHENDFHDVGRWKDWFSLAILEANFAHLDEVFLENADVSRGSTERGPSHEHEGEENILVGGGRSLFLPSDDAQGLKKGGTVGLCVSERASRRGVEAV